MPMYFGVLASAGLAIASFGWLIHKYQDRLHDTFADLMERLSISNLTFDCCCSYDDYDGDGDEDSLSNLRTRLLPSTADDEEELDVPAEQGREV